MRGAAVGASVTTDSPGEKVRGAAVGAGVTTDSPG